MNGSERTTVEQRWVLGLASLGAMMVALDVLVVAAALATIRQDLGASIQDLEWTVNAYGLSFAMLLMTAAALGDRWGRRRTFAAGLAVFSLASIVCALADSVALLIAARAVQGIGAAIVMPLAMGVLGAVFASAGGYESFTTGITRTLAVCGVLSLLGALAGLGIGVRRTPSPAPVLAQREPVEELG